MIKSLKPQYTSKADYYIEVIIKQKNEPQKNKKKTDSTQAIQKKTDESKK